MNCMTCDFFVVYFAIVRFEVFPMKVSALGWMRNLARLENSRRFIYTKGWCKLSVIFT